LTLTWWGGQRKGYPLQQTTESMPRDSQACELLKAYQGVLDTISDLPLAPMVLWRRAGRGGWGVLHYLPRPRWLLRYFVVRHISRVLASLGRRYSARAALGWAADGEQQDREAVREFQQSVPPPRVRTYLTLLIVATVVLGRPIIDRLVSQALQLTVGNPSGSELRREARETFQTLAEALSVDFTSLNSAVNALLNEGLREVAIVALGLALSLYVVLRPFVPAFRLKRMLFNLAPELQGRRRSAVAQWSVSQATGIYERERRLFEALGGRPPREFPFDLIVPALIMLLPLAWGGLLFRLALIGPLLEDRMVFLSGALFMWTPSLVRLGWLFRAWQRRQPGHAGPYMPFEVCIRGGRAVARVERPLGVRFLLFLLLLSFGLAGFDPAVSLPGNLQTALEVALVLSLPITLLWWHRMNRELRDLDQTYDPGKSGRRPILSRLITIVGWLVLVPAFIRTGRRLRRAQARAGQPETLRFAWMLAPGLLLHPFLFAYLQHQLNKVWTVEGEPLDPWRADPSQDMRCSSKAMPWVRDLRVKPPTRQRADV
jgi:hypothetical protein